jgi:hypothetical protein
LWAFQPSRGGASKTRKQIRKVSTNFNSSRFRPILPIITTQPKDEGTPHARINDYLLKPATRQRMAPLLCPGFNTVSRSRLRVSIASPSEERAYTPGQSSWDPPPPWDFTVVSSPKAASSQFLPLNRTTGEIGRISTKQELHLAQPKKQNDTPSFEFRKMAWYTFIKHISPHQPFGVSRDPRRVLRILTKSLASKP